MSESGKGLALGIVGVLLIGLMATQCQKKVQEAPKPTVSVSVR